MNVGIIIPVVYKPSDDPLNAMHPIEADLKAHHEYYRKVGAVYWDMNVLQGLSSEDVRREKNVRFPTCCYFYDSNPDSETYKKVIYRAEIFEAYKLEEFKDLLEKKPDEWSFIPSWRMQCIKGRWDIPPKEHPEWVKEKHYPSDLWIKLKNFEELNPPQDKSRFRKWDGGRLRGVRGAYIICP
jgi:hypothetical protein